MGSLAGRGGGGGVGSRSGEGDGVGSRSGGGGGGGEWSLSSPRRGVALDDVSMVVISMDWSVGTSGSGAMATRGVSSMKGCAAGAVARGGLNELSPKPKSISCSVLSGVTGEGGGERGCRGEQNTHHQLIHKFLTSYILMMGAAQYIHRGNEQNIV